MSEKFLSSRVKKMAISATIAMSAKSRSLSSQGLDVINLSLGEPDFNTPDVIKNAAKEAIDQNYSKYTPIAGFDELKQAISNKFKRENNIAYKKSEIVVSTGAKQSLANVILALIDEGDEVLLPAPYWVSYAEQIKLAGGIPREIPTTIDTDFKITPQQLQEAITSKTKMIIYSSPCNPSGSLYTRNELDQLAKIILRKEDLFILADEIYEYINFTGIPHASMASNPDIWDRVITVNGVAKGFAMTGWRIGYIGAPEWICNASAKIQGQFTSGANAVAQRATITALNYGIELTTEMKIAFEKRRNLVFNLLCDIPGIIVNKPQGAFYFFPNVSTYFGKTFGDEVISNAQDLCLFILNKGLVATVPGDAFGDSNCLRISYATSEEVLVEAMGRISKVLKLLK
jgi:aspartate aminotransferase